MVNAKSGPRTGTQQNSRVKVSIIDDLAQVQTQKEYLTTNEVAEMLGCSTVTVQRWRTSGGGPPFYRVGSGKNNIKYHAKDVAAWLAEKKYNNTSQYLQERGAK